MWVKNLKVLGVAAFVLAFYTMVAHVVPQQPSAAPESINMSGASPEVLASAGEKVFNGAGGCTACHGLGTRAPNLLTDEKGEGPIGARCGKRKPGMDCKAYLYESLTAPSAFIVKGYEPMMPDMRRQLSNDQIWAAVAFLESQGGTIDVSSSDISGTATGGGEAKPADASSGGQTVTATTDPKKIITERGCLGCHQMGSEGANLGPAFDHIGTLLKADEIRRKVLDPTSMTAKGFETFKGVMPATFGEQLSAKQLEILVSFLASQK
jgi:mono/diheme cytochrome c family protein